MSYDLYLRPRSGSVLGVNEFAAYFRGRADYALDGEKAFYGNEDTGVYFFFERQSASPGDPDYPLLFNINFFRPSVFIEEAAPEVSAFVKAFDLVASDGQIKGMGEGDYDEAGLISGWRYGNHFACRSFLADPGADFGSVLLPGAVIHRAWKWNFGRAALQRRVGGAKYVGVVMVARFDDRAATFTVWPDAIPSILPVAEYVLAPRETLAPRRFLRTKPDQVLLKFEEAAVLFRRWGSVDDDCVSLDYDQPPQDVCDFIRARNPHPQKITAIPFANVIDQELTELVS